MTIRPARASDVPALQQIAVRAYERYVSRMGQEPAVMRPDFSHHVANDSVWVWDEREVLAYAVIIKGKDDPLLDNIAVAPKTQGQWLGSKLLAHVEAHLREEGFKAYTLYTNVHMTENIAWYARQGFTETGRGIQDGFERVFFRKEL